MDKKTIPRMVACKSITRGYMEAYTFGSMVIVAGSTILAVVAGCSRVGWW